MFYSSQVPSGVRCEVVLGALLKLAEVVHVGVDLVDDYKQKIKIRENYETFFICYVPLCEDLAFQIRELGLFHEATSVVSDDRLN